MHINAYENVKAASLPTEVYYLDLRYHDYNPQTKRFALGRLDCPGKLGIPEGAIVFVTPSLLSGSDYGGGAVTRVNHDEFLKMYGDRDGVHDLYGGYGSYGVAIRADVSDPEIIETLLALKEYPSIDDEALSRHESEKADEAWENWARYEFTLGLRRHDVDLDDVDLAVLKTFFDDKVQTLNAYWENEEGDNAYINVSKIAAACTRAELLELPGAKDEQEQEEDADG